MINVKHIQYPVGQGGLHLGVIGDYAYIYDCGGYGKNVAWEKIFEKIKAEIRNCKELDIFISHLHEDHYNQVKELKEYIDKNLGKNIIIKSYLPYSSNVEKVIYIYEYLLKNDYVSARKEFDFKKCAKRKQEQLEEYIEDVKSNIDDSISIRASDNDDKEGKVIPVNKGIKTYDMILLPYVTNITQKEQNDFIRNIANEDIKKQIKSGKIDSFEKDFWDAVRFAYEQKFSKRITHKNMLCLYCGQTVCSNNKYESWLHTGDAVMKNNEDINGFKHRYGALLDNVTNMQVPHHGSINNHNSEFPNGLSSDCQSFFITAQSDPKSTKKFVKPYLNNIDLYPDKSITQYFETQKSTLIQPIGAKNAK